MLWACALAPFPLRRLAFSPPWLVNRPSHLRHRQANVMKSFQYATASSPASARELLGQNGRYLAGGIDLLAELKEYIAEPNVLVNVKAMPTLDKIEPGIQSWSIGTNVTIAQLENHSELKNVFPGLQQAAAEVGSQ